VDLLSKPLSHTVKLDWEKALYVAFVLLALCTRLWGLGDRVQSHDESIHAKYSWNLYSGYGFQHSPLMHGPFLFHATALSYFLFGDNDFTARLPVALIGVALVLFPYFLRRWIGRAGALVASFLLLISPSIAYYSRYIRHDVPSLLWSLIAIFSIFSYLRAGHRNRRWLYLLAAAISLTFATKEVAFFYAAIFGFFLIILLLLQALRRDWPREEAKTWFTTAMLAVIAGVLILGLGLVLDQLDEADQASQPQAPEEPAAQQEPLNRWVAYGSLLAALGLLAVAVSLLVGHLGQEDLTPPTFVVVLIATVVIVGLLFRIGLPILLPRVTSASIPTFEWPAGKHILGGLYVDVRMVLTCLPFACGILASMAWFAIAALRRYRTFDLIVLLGALCLPFLSPLLIALSGLDPISYTSPTIYYSISIVVQVFLLSIAIGLMWDLQRQTENKHPFTWLTAAAIHYAIFVIFFTTFLTNSTGIASGLGGSLGYWLKQQDVKRGGQPGYYYLIMASLYEYLPLLLTLAAPIYLCIRKAVPRLLRSEARRDSFEMKLFDTKTFASKEYFIPFLLWWTTLSWIGYSIAGEKMPWLTVHLALPMILLSGWLIGRLLEWIDWQQIFRSRAWILALVVPPFVMALALLIESVTAAPSQGQELARLYETGQLMNGLVGVLLFGALSYLVWCKSGWRAAASVLLLLALLLLTGLTIRTAWRLCYVNDEHPTEFLVYAHAAPGVEKGMQQVEDLSRRITGAPNQIEVSYGSDGSTLFYWQLRDYANSTFYGDNPSREALSLPVVIAGEAQWGDVAPYLGDNYFVNTYAYLWWPMQDYFHLDWERVKYAIINPQMRAAVWDIWYDRDYHRYDELTGKAHTLDKWPLRSDFRLYVRRDVLDQVWDLSTTDPDALTPPVDPYAEGWRELTASLVFGSSGTALGQLQSPRGIAVGPEGFIYVADSGNHRIQKFTPNGQAVAAWGRESTVETETGAPQGFLEPWDVAVAPDGAIYVADTWNHRIQRLDSSGNLLDAWGAFGQYKPEDPAGQGLFYGARGVAVNASGRVYVADTGNKRVQVFEPDGTFAFQWGGGGVVEGYLDEPVGVAFGPAGKVYVADTWNRRVQVFDENGVFLRQWPIAGWDVGHGEEKPYLAVDSKGYVYVTDPAHYRVLVFDSEGNYTLSFGQYGFDDRSFAFPTGIALGQDDSIYLTDAHANRVMVFDALDAIHAFPSTTIE